ncbi:hypothetical protein OIN60_18160 [Paenibacillus sp. P96]|uniref:Uncharacterized protein n=1 Tax=Paenibacillus zeirhizosphaerae TaxID=2987519 RepID=A0ABT9FVL8_9BACL|nr:hypothetical protein [Paenibacillus sp. P96]MDP4098660.1 hypothetical protein [Paenibacillus sp. P96]
MIIVLAIAVLILVIIRLVKKRDTRAVKRRRLFYKQAPIPASTGSGKHDSIIALWNKLEQDLPASYAEAVRSRTLQEHPDISEQEFAWRWHELKRFFVLCALMNRVPMFSLKVDEIWHQMLMFTREYEQFSNRYYGRMLHHAPNAGSQPMPNERAWFDAVYVQCFGWNTYSAGLWGRFFTEPLPQEDLEMYASRSVDLEQASHWNMHGYRNRPEIRKAVDWLLQRLRTHVHTARRRNDNDLSPVDYSQSDALFFNTVWFSMNEPQDFQKHMVDPQGEKVRGHSGSNCSSASGCGYSDSGDNDSSSRHDSSRGHDSSGSSCSSCSSSSSGSSCSSSD